MGGRLTQQRKQLIGELQMLAMGGPDSGYTSAVEKTEQLRTNMAKEVHLGSLLCCAVLCESLA